MQAELEQKAMVNEKISEVILVTQVRSHEALETQVVSQAAFLSGGSRGDFLACSACRGCSHALSCGPHLLCGAVTANSGTLLVSSHLFPHLQPLLPSSSSCKDSCGSMGSTPTVQSLPYFKVS